MKNSKNIKYWWTFEFLKTRHVSYRMLAATEKEATEFLKRWVNSDFGKENPIRLINDGRIYE